MRNDITDLQDGSTTDPSTAWREYLQADPDAFAAEFATAVAYLRDGDTAGLAEHVERQDAHSQTSTRSLR